MEFDSAQFALFALLACAILRFEISQDLRVIAIACLNVLFLASFVPSLLSVVPLVGFAALGYIIVLLAACLSTRSLIVLGFVFVVLFIWLKGYTIVAFVPALHFPIIVLGLSYILFRILHLIIDLHEGAIKRPGVVEYFSYIFFFLSLVSGPIQRYQSFIRQLEKPVECDSGAAIQAAVNRILIGYFMVAFASSIAESLFARFEASFFEAVTTGAMPTTVIGAFAASAVLYTFFLYFNFAGYMHLVIGIGRLCRFDLPENFNRPYLASNFLGFWARWHITLSDWFKIYVFNPLTKATVARWGTSRTIPYLGCVSYFVTFALLGAWHGTSNVFLVYGVLLGIGVSANKLYQVQVEKLIGKQAYRALAKNVWYQSLCRGLTLSYFVVAVACLWITPQEATALLSVSVLAAMFAAFALIFVGIFGLSYAVCLVEPLTARWMREYLGERLRQGRAAPVLSSVAFFTLFSLVIALGNETPEFVYQGF